MSETFKGARNWQILRRILIGLAIFATLIAIFYSEEDWRGRRAWEDCKQELEAKGVALDWNTYIPPPVPDDQNFFKAQKMNEWFVRPRPGDNVSNDLTSRLNHSFGPKLYHIAELTILPCSTNAPTQNADMILRYNRFETVPFSPVTVMEANVSSTEIKIALIQFADVPITAAIENLARQAGINYMLDPQIPFGRPDKNGKIIPEPRLSFRWEDISAREILLAILSNYGLQLIYDPKNNLVARITIKDLNAPKIYATPDVRDRLKELFAGVIGTNILSINQDYAILKRPSGDIKPMRVVIESNTMPDTNEMRELLAEAFPNADAKGKYYSPRITVESDGSNTFRMMLDAAMVTDYLAWSDQFERDFNLMRGALNRPYARMDGDYSKPYEMPAPNFLAVRIVAQTLAQRAKCYLFVGQPENALHDLTLIHDMSRLFLAAPSGKPMTLVAAMINVAVTGLYADTLSRGMQWHAWQEPQLGVLQAQLTEINLSSFVLQAFREEPAAICRNAETLSFLKFANLAQTVPENWQHKIVDCLWPSGWTYQNMVNIAELYQNWPRGIDLAHNMILPGNLDLANHNVNKFVKSAGRLSPYKYLAAIAVPDFSRAFQSTACNQTMVNEAQIACALERYHFAHGEYPESLDTLVPQFMEKIPHDIIGGQPLHYLCIGDGKFLLYSVGWNETDEGGLPGILSDAKKGDWVWQHL